MKGRKTDAGRLERRSFLKVVGLAGAAVAAVAKLAGRPVEAKEAEAKETHAEEVKARYRESAEVKNFYDLNRL